MSNKIRLDPLLKEVFTGRASTEASVTILFALVIVGGPICNIFLEPKYTAILGLAYLCASFVIVYRTLDNNHAELGVDDDSCSNKLDDRPHSKI